MTMRAVRGQIDQAKTLLESMAVLRHMALAVCLSCGIWCFRKQVGRLEKLGVCSGSCRFKDSLQVPRFQLRLQQDVPQRQAVL